jgi:hypothetical protein
LWLRDINRINSFGDLGINERMKLKLLLEDYRLTVERRFARPNDPESFTGWSNPCQTGQRVGARRSVVLGPPGRVLDLGITSSPRKNLPLRNNGEGQDPHRVVVPVKKKKKIKIYLRKICCEGGLN